ncbi:MAG TPA: hypothetical protein QGF08_04945 [Candidatus Marinimicrobia bacterium]|jgi:hypothetical protein|nr:hypothetical protein [Candidatus Neomarinimicrobiota bacterium]HBN45950.1 hypothetical protein [Candidatus Neomarinimicrobiota bacterium]HJL75234.1 hypothetical protein [Candidatus Neomarinimicrobiota bacterium]HJM70211.1 hypothetical protein [Candidatus Neomarinimicrobiota bacterium]|tara:strand:- start:16898 stop:17422 length:525 start_codon:yes stop_codon:yes gene_type:complete
MNLNKLVRASIFAALAIGAGFSLLMIPNVELITVIIFTAGLYLGPVWGLIVGGTAEMIFSGLNPLGSGLSFPPLFFAQVIGMAGIGFAGGLFHGVFMIREYSKQKVIAIGFTGFALTFIFDSLTTLSYPLSAGFDLSRTIGLYISGIGFTLLHQVANGVIFAIGVPRITKFLAK